MMQYAVMGQPIEHSLSPFIHQYFAKQLGLEFEYGKILVNPTSFQRAVEAFFQAGGRGLNITSPCKQQAFAIADEATARCIKSRAANTLWRQDGKLMADTTDGVGLMRDLSRYLDICGKRLLILGAGGVVRSILEPLIDAEPASITLANRTISRAAALRSEFKFHGHGPPRHPEKRDRSTEVSLDLTSAALSLQATRDDVRAVAMNHDALIKVVELERLNQPYDIIIHAIPSQTGHIIFLPKIIFQKALLAYDLSYSPQGNTSFMVYARSLGCQSVDGFGMLVCQAAESFKIWHQVMPDISDLLCSREILLG